MTRGKKLLLLLGVLVIAAGAALSALRLSRGDTAEPETPETVILSLDPEELTAFRWTWEDREPLLFLRTEEDWEYASDTDFPLNELSLRAVLSAVRTVTAGKTIPDAEDPAQYGLDAPLCAVEAQTASGEILRLDIGDETGLGGQRYVSTGDGNVYLCDASLPEAFDLGLYDLVQTEPIPYMAEVNALSLRAGDRELSVLHLPESGLAYSDAYEWFLDTEERPPLDTERTRALAEAFTMMTWGGCVEYAADEDTLASCGLEDPAAVITVDYTASVQVATDLTDSAGNVIYDTQERPAAFVLELGRYEGASYCYARLAGSSMVYLVDGGLLDRALGADYEALRPDEVLAADWSKVTEMEVTLDGETYTLRRETVDDSDGAQDGADPYDDVELTYETVWTLEGRPVALEDALAALTGLAVDSYAGGIVPEGEALLRLLLRQDSETWPEVELVFYPRDDAVCLAVRTGEDPMLVSRAGTESLIRDLSVLLAPEETEPPSTLLP